jgi:AcrR family transcriptional regulator
MIHGDKRAEIVRAALELIAEHGFHGAPISMIAERSGVAAGTIYRYFENKDALIIDLYREIDAKIYVAIMDGYAAEKPVRECFQHIITVLLHYFIEHPSDFSYLEQFHNSPYGVAVRREKILGNNGGFNIYRVLLEEGVAQEVIKNLPLVVLFALAFAPLKAVTRDHILGFITLDDGLIEQIMEASWDGIRR